MKNKNPIFKIFVSTFTIILIVVIMVLLVIFPTIKYIKSLKQDIQKIEQESDEQYQKIKLLKKSIAELDTIKEKTEKLNGSMIEKTDTVKIIQELEDLASEKNVSQSLSISEGTADNFIFNFEVRGGFYEAFDYLQALEHLPFYLIIDSVSWNKINDENVSLTFKATIFVK